MGVENSSYELTILVSPDDAIDFDTDYCIFKMRKSVPSAKIYLNEEGRSSGAAGDWCDLSSCLLDFSNTYPDVLFLIEESYIYEDQYEARHYIRNGKHCVIEPVMTWPEFEPSMLDQ